MLKSFTWGQFFGFTTVIFLIYYVAIAIIYYRREIIQLVRGGKLVARTTRGAVQVPVADDPHIYLGPDDYYDQPDDQQRAYDQVNVLTDELSDMFTAAAAEGWQKEFLLIALQEKLSDHRNLAGTPFETSVNNYIAIQADKSGFARISADEMRGIWMKG